MSRTPIAPGLTHNPVQDTMDQARFDAISDLVPGDIARRVIKQTGRRLWIGTARDTIQHPLQALWSVIRFPLKLAGWLLYAVVHRNRHPQPKRTNERLPSDVDIVRREVARMWFHAIHLYHDPRRGEPFMLGLSEDLFPPFPKDRLSGFPSWASLLVHHCQGDLDEAGAGELITAFAARVRATIDAQEFLDLPLGIVIRRNGTRYIAERRSA